LALARATAPTLAEVENAYGHVLGAPAVVLFPSARAAIHVVLRATLGMQAPVVCPAYTCDVVHQALDLLRARTHYVDTAAESFLMSPADIGSALEPESAVILSEIYGMPYDADAIDGVCPGGERLRIFDLAMCICRTDADCQGQVDGRRLAGRSAAARACSLAAGHAESTLTPRHHRNAFCSVDTCSCPWLEPGAEMGRRLR
jgi:hypothetical protein